MGGGGFSAFSLSPAFLSPGEDSQGIESAVLFLPCIADRGRRWLLEALPLSVPLSAWQHRSLADSFLLGDPFLGNVGLQRSLPGCCWLPASCRASGSGASCSRGSARRPGPLLAPGGHPRHRARGAARARRASPGARLAQNRSLFCITIGFTFKFTFSTPPGAGLPLPAGIWRLRSHPPRRPWHWELAARRHDRARPGVEGLGGGGGRGHIRRGGAQVAAELGPATAAPARPGPPSERQPRPLSESSQGWIHF